MAKPTNTFDSFASPANVAPLHLEPFPKLSELTTEHGFKEGFRQFDLATERWRQTLEKAINEKLIKATTVQAGNPG